jgi:dephospho-CoA kinase
VKKGFTLGEIKQRTRTQLPFGRKIRHADYVVDNSGSISDTGKQIENIVKKMKNKQWKAANRLGQPLSRI